MRPRLLGQMAVASVLALTPDKRDEIFVSYLSISVGLICLAGLMSGLTLGLLSLDTLDLEVRISKLLSTHILATSSQF